LACGLLQKSLPNCRCDGTRRVVHQTCRHFLNRWLGAPGPVVSYPRQFMIFTAVVLANVCIWLFSCNLYSLPALQETYKIQVEEGRSHSKLTKIRIDYTRVLAIYMGWFLFVRAIHFVPAISSRAAHWNACPRDIKGCCVKFLMGDGLVYVFIAASGLLGLSAMHSNDTGEVRILNIIAIAILGIQGVSVGLICLFHVMWHHYVMLDSLPDFRAKRCVAPPNTIHQLETRAYDEHVFGEGRLFHGECPICLGMWESSDQIKVTPCQHAFHEGCIESWLTSARTCALCRLDLVDAVTRSA